MIFSVAAALAIATAPPASNPPKAPPPVVVVDSAKPAPKGKKASNSKSDPMADFGKFMLMFDKFFPAQPEPDAARLDLARTSMTRLLPNGAYGRAIGTMIETMADKALGMSEADFGFGAKDSKAASTETLRQSLVKDDPYFNEREKIIRRIAKEELVKMFAIMEPSLREGLAKSLARRMDDKQLAELNAFLATDAGKAYGEQSIGMWFDTDVYRSMFQAMPGMVMAAPGVLARFEKETAHLPKPPKKKAEPAAEKAADEGDDHEHMEDAGE